ncbi:MAG: hypothetical protein HY716_04100 [Planctomycetes bacterium]|nr:hypothetical protein [Planctomycetota bacterium]
MSKQTTQDHDLEIIRLRARQDGILKRLHELTLARDRKQMTDSQTLQEEAALALELGQIQDRLRGLGAHLYNGCPDCVANRPRPSFHSVQS